MELYCLFYEALLKFQANLGLEEGPFPGLKAFDPKQAMVCGLYALAMHLTVPRRAPRIV